MNLEKYLLKFGHPFGEKVKNPKTTERDEELADFLASHNSTYTYEEILQALQDPEHSDILDQLSIDSADNE